jgi:hypothetical protein
VCREDRPRMTAAPMVLASVHPPTPRGPDQVNILLFSASSIRK